MQHLQREDDREHDVHRLESVAVDASSIAAGDSNTMDSDESTMHTMMIISNCLSSTTLWQNTRTGLVDVEEHQRFALKLVQRLGARSGHPGTIRHPRRYPSRRTRGGPSCLSASLGDGALLDARLPAASSSAAMIASSSSRLMRSSPPTSESGTPPPDTPSWTWSARRELLVRELGPEPLLLQLLRAPLLLLLLLGHELEERDALEHFPRALVLRVDLLGGRSWWSRMAMKRLSTRKLPITRRSTKYSALHDPLAAMPYGYYRIPILAGEHLEHRHERPEQRVEVVSRSPPRRPVRTFYLRRAASRAARR